MTHNNNELNTWINALLQKAPYVLLADFLLPGSLSHFLLWGKMEENLLMFQVL